MASPKRTIALVTGANQGIGLTTAQILARDYSYHVIIGSRNVTAGEQAVLAIRAEGHSASHVQLDLNSKASIEDAVGAIEREYGHLDVLVNNAGVLLDINPTLSTWELYNETFRTNVIGTGFLTESLLPLFRRAQAGPPRVVFVTSGMGSLTFANDKEFPYYSFESRVYDASKAAVNMLMLNFSRVMNGGPISSLAKVNAVCPGQVATSLTNFEGHSTEVGASRIVEMATLGEDGPSGTFSDRNGPLPW